MPALPNSPFVSIDSTRVAVDAPVSTDLLTDIVVNENYLLSAVNNLGGINARYFTGSNTWTAPNGITQVKVRMWSGGGGGGSGGNNASNGNDGADGGVTWFNTSSFGARQGKNGKAGVIGGASGATAASWTPTFSGQLIMFGRSNSNTPLGGGIGGGQDFGIITGFGIFGSANGTAGNSAAAGGNGVAGTGQGGGGSGGNSSGGNGGGGSAGGPGEYAEYFSTVVPGTTYTVTVGAGGAGGAGLSNTGAGGNGGSGLLIVEF